jgi:cobalt-zinc-cadmium efflux system protein
VSIAIAVVILWSSWGLKREALNLALDAVPGEINRGAVESYLASLPDVSEVHDLHIWAMSTTETALTVHLVRPRTEVDVTLGESRVYGDNAAPTEIRTAGHRTNA